jgi:uncharacterized protein
VKIAGTYTINAPQDQVWAALNDIEVLARIVPGCERLEQTGENEFQGTVKIGIQSIKGTYNGRIRLEDIQPPRHYRLVANGKSANGVVDGSGTVDLVEQDGKTLLSYTGDAQIGGTLASVGQRLIEGASRQMINQSLKALADQIAARAAGPVAQNGVAAPAQPAATPPPSAPVSAAPPAAAAPVVLPASPPASPSSSQPSSAAQPAFAPRTVVVPEYEQLKPETILRGVVTDILKERPWLPAGVIAFLLGYLLGRRRS